MFLANRLNFGEYYTFKFVSWHPHCRCIAISILASREEIKELELKLLNVESTENFKSSNTIDKMPKDYMDWIIDNKDRILRAKQQPYFIRDNYRGGVVTGGLRL